MLTNHKTSHIVLHKNKPHITLLRLFTGSSWAGWRSKAALSIAWLTQNTTTGWWQRGNIQNNTTPRMHNFLAQSNAFSSKDGLKKSSSVAIVDIKDYISASTEMMMMMIAIIIINVVLCLYRIFLTGRTLAMDIASTSHKAIRNMALRNLDSFLRRAMGELNISVYFPKLRRSQIP